MAHRNIIVVGASAGAVEILLDFAAELPASFPASIFIVLHTPAGRSSEMAELLSRRGPLPASHPVHGEEILAGRIYVASADTHLLIRPGFIGVVRGPKENGHRPAVDPLFRSASWAYGPRVIAVVLSGHQDCGTAGMMSVKARGGLAVVQDPSTAVAPEMPQSVLRRVAVDHVVHPLELPALLTRLVAEDLELPDERPVSPEVEVLEGARKGDHVDLVCPSCSGVLTSAHLGVFDHFRCHVGHAFTLDGLVRAQSEDMERALWAAVRSLEEGAGLSRRLATGTPDEDLRRRFAENGANQLRQANLIRKILLEGAAKFAGAERALGPDEDEDEEAAPHEAPPAGNGGSAG